MIELTKTILVWLSAVPTITTKPFIYPGRCENTRRGARGRTDIREAAGQNSVSAVSWSKLWFETGDVTSLNIFLFYYLCGPEQTYRYTFRLTQADARTITGQFTAHQYDLPFKSSILSEGSLYVLSLSLVSLADSPECAVWPKWLFCCAVGKRKKAADGAKENRAIYYAAVPGSRVRTS